MTCSSVCTTIFTCFNGAAELLQRRAIDDAVEREVEPTRFNGAAELLQRRVRRGSQRSLAREGFNGAAELLQRRVSAPRSRRKLRRSASTEPLNCFSGEDSSARRNS